MRAAFIAERLRERAEMLPGTVDVEWLLDFEGRLSVYVDEDGPAAERLRNAGVTVSVAAKRYVDDGSGNTISSEHGQAVSVLAEHQRAPFDLLIYDSDRPVDLAWFEPELAAIARVVAPGSAATADAELVLSSSSVFAESGHALWTQAASVLSADALLSRLPPTVWALGEFDGPIFAPDASTITSREVPLDPVGLVVVVAMHGDLRARAGLLRRVFALTCVNAGTTVALITQDVEAGAGRSVDEMLSRLSTDQREATIVVGPGSDHVAFGMLEQADVVVAADVRDVAIPGVWDRAQLEGVVVLKGSVAAGEPLRVPPSRRTNVALISTQNGMSEAALAVGLIEDSEMIVLHTARGTRLAARLVDMASSAWDAAVLVAPHAMTGAPVLSHFSPDVLAIHRNMLPSVTTRIGAAGSLWELIVWMVGLSGADRMRLVAFAAPRGTTVAELPALDVAGLPPILDGRPALDRPNLAEVQPVKELAKAEVAVDTPDVRAWVKAHRWSDRIRLALPWKLGLLGRAMKDRW